MTNFIKPIGNTRFFQVFNFSSDQAKGRSCILIQSFLFTIINNLTTGIFYTGFLLANDVDIVQVGIVGFIPFLANTLSIFSPVILERFKKRKLLLCGSRMIYFALNIAGITLVPSLGLGKEGTLFAIVALVFLANAVNALFTAGFQVWHVNFLPDDVRPDYFSFSQIFGGLMGGITLLTSSIIADALKNSGQYLTILTLLRWVAFAISILEVTMLSLPKEFPYEKTMEKPSLKNTVLLPFKHRKFLLTMVIAFSWTLVANMLGGLLDAYLLQDVKASYTFVNIINSTYFFFLLFLAPFWKWVLRKFSWFKTFALTIFMNVPFILLYSFVTHSNYLILLPIVRLSQHFIGVGMNLAYANTPIINLPKGDQTNYISFYIVITNLAAFFGQMGGTGFVAATKNTVLHLFGLDFTSVQMLLGIHAVGQLLVALLVLRLLPHITPDPK